MYCQGLQKKALQQRPDIYEQELLDLFDAIYDMRKKEFKSDLVNHPNDLQYWFDYIDPIGELHDISVDAIGPKIHSYQQDKIRKLYDAEIPPVVMIDAGSTPISRASLIAKCEGQGQAYSNVTSQIYKSVSIGTIGLIKGVNTYRLDKNIKLATYASRCIDNEILMYLRKTKRKRTEISFEDNLSYDAEGNELHLEDVLGTDADIVTKGLEDELDRKMLYQEVAKLEGRDKEIIEYRYGLNGKKELTQKEVANLMGISQSYISRIEKKVIKKLQMIIKL